MNVDTCTQLYYAQGTLELESCTNMVICIMIKQMIICIMIKQIMICIMIRYILIFKFYIWEHLELKLKSELKLSNMYAYGKLFTLQDN